MVTRHAPPRKSYKTHTDVSVKINEWQGVGWYQHWVSYVPATTLSRHYAPRPSLKRIFTLQIYPKCLYTLNLFNFHARFGLVARENEKRRLDSSAVSYISGFKCTSQYHFKAVLSVGIQQASGIRQAFSLLLVSLRFMFVWLHIGYKICTFFRSFVLLCCHVCSFVKNVGFELSLSLPRLSTTHTTPRALRHF